MDGQFAELLGAARRGDDGAIAALYSRHHRRLLRVLRAEAGDAADDIASQAWLELFGGLGQFRGDEAGFRSLLYTIARRRLLDHRRRTRRRPTVPLPEEDALGKRSLAGAPGVEDVVVAATAADEAVARIVEVLGPDAAHVVLLRVVGGLSVAEVAEVTGVAPGTVRVQVHRALRKLADAFGERAVDA